LSPLIIEFVRSYEAPTGSEVGVRPAWAQRLEVKVLWGP